MLIATGKNVRYAARIATDFQPATPFEPSPTTTIGAIARIGTVCEATMYGRIPRSSSRDCERATASPKPTTPPRRKPASASLPVNHAALSSDADERRAARGRRLPERRDDVVQVRHRRVVDDERPRPAASSPRATCSPPEPPEGETTHESRARGRATFTRDVDRASHEFSDYHTAEWRCILARVPLEPARVVDDLKALRELTGDAERSPACGVDGHLGEGARVPAGEGCADRRRRGDRRGREPVVHPARRLRPACS